MTMATKAEQAAAEANTEALAAPVGTDSAAAVDSAEGFADSTQVKVPKDAGDELVLTRGVDVIGRYKVNDGLVTVKDDGERAMLLASVPGATLV